MQAALGSLQVLPGAPVGQNKITPCTGSAAAIVNAVANVEDLAGLSAGLGHISQQRIRVGFMLLAVILADHRAKVLPNAKAGQILIQHSTLPGGDDAQLKSRLLQLFQQGLDAVKDLGGVLQAIQMQHPSVKCCVDILDLQLLQGVHAGGYPGRRSVPP